MAGTVVGMLVEFKAKSQQLDAAFKKSEQGMQMLRKDSQKTQKSFDGVAVSAKKMLGIIGGVTAVVGAIKSVSDSTVVFSKVMGELSAITGAVGKDLEFLKQASLNFGRTTTTGASDAAEAMKLIASAKPELLSNVKALEAVTKEVVTLSSASGVAMPQAVEAAVGSLNQFGLGADQAARFVNVLAAGSKYGSSEVAQTGAALAKVGVVASQAGLSFEETNAALQILAANGQKAEIAGTGLRGVLLKLMTQTNQNFNPAIVGMQKAFENLAKAGLTATQQKKLFGDEGITVAQILTKEAAALDKMEASITKTGVAYEQANINANTYAATVKKLGNAVEGLKISVGESVEGGGFLKMLTSDLNLTSKAITEQGTALGFLKSALIDIPGQRGSYFGQMLLPDPGDNGATETTNLKDLAGNSPEMRSANRLLNTGISDKQRFDDTKKEWADAINSVFRGEPMESFIQPIASAGTKVEVFAETVEQASAKLQNAFTGAFDNADGVASDIIGKLGQEDRKKYEDAGKDIDKNFLDNVKEAAQLVNKIKFTGGSDSEKRRLDELQLGIGKRAFSGGGGGSAVDTANGGTFSVVPFMGGSDNEATKQIMQKIATDFDKFAQQQLETEHRVKIEIELNEKMLKAYVKAEGKKTITQIAQEAATKGAK